ncbi:MAG: bifunctional adenosylcobinamide kinase/adenosylcobinamide-phosphate guanylyltransferase [Dehalococcoidia bacterium]
MWDDYLCPIIWIESYLSGYVCLAGIYDSIMSKKCVFISGGARSGKSRFAQELAASSGEKVLFVATAEPLNPDMQARIIRHQEERSHRWDTLEAPVDLAAEIKQHFGKQDVVLVDCLTLLTSNIILGQSRGFSGSVQIDEQTAEKNVITEINGLIELMKASTATFIIVSNEVGLGLVPDNEVGRIYRDLLGKANQLVASHADEVYFMFSGIPVKVK